MVLPNDNSFEESEIYLEENQYHVGALPAHDLSNQLYFQVLRRQISLKSSLQIKK